MSRLEVTTVALVAVVSFVALVPYLPIFLASDDAAYYANVMIDMSPGWMDGKPVYVWIGHLMFRLATMLGASRPSLVFVFGLYSTAFMSLTGLALYSIYRSLFHEPYVGIIAALTALFSPIGLSTSLSIAPYPVSLFFVSVAMAAWLRRKYFAWSIAWSLAIASHASSLLLAPVWLLSLLLPDYKDAPRLVAKHIPIVLLVCALCFGWVLAHYPSLDYYVRFNLYVTQRDYLEPITTQWFSTRLEALLQSNGLMMLVLSAVGSYFLTRLGTSRNTVLLMWLVSYLAFCLFWPQAGGKFYIFCLPPLSLLAALGIRRLSTALGQILPRFSRSHSGLGVTRMSAPIGVLLVLLVLVGGMAQGYETVARMSVYPNEYAVAGMAINDWAASSNISSTVVIISAWETHYIRFYAPTVKVVGWYGTVFPDNQTQIELLVLNTINRAFLSHDRVFMTRLWYSLEATGDRRIAFAARMIADHYRIVEVNDLLLEIV